MTEVLWPPTPPAPVAPAVTATPEVDCRGASPERPVQLWPVPGGGVQVSGSKVGQRFGVILADPPWRFQNWSMEEKAKRGEEWARRNGRSPYDTLDTEDIANLKVQEIAAKDSVLLLWATNPKLEDALLVMRGWGFQYKTKLTWAKMHRAAAPRVGLGYRARACTEDLLLGTRGNPPLPPPDQRPQGLMFCPIGRHSAKPSYQYDIAEAYEGPYLEMFHRPASEPQLFGAGRPDWTFIGNEVDGLDIREALARLIGAPDA